MKFRQEANKRGMNDNNGLEKPKEGAFGEYVTSIKEIMPALDDEKSLVDVLNSQSEIRAPADFTDKVMKAVHKLQESSGCAFNGTMKQIYNICFKRLGYSMVVASLVLLAGYFIPVNQDQFYAVTDDSARNIAVDMHGSLTNSFGRANDLFSGILKNINQSIERLKEV